MTRTDYIKLARLLCDMYRQKEITYPGIKRMVRQWLVSNPRFNEAKFWSEMGLTMCPDDQGTQAN